MSMKPPRNLNIVELTLKLIILVFVLLVWAVIGFLLWIPLLARVIIVYSGVVASSMFVDVSADKSEEALNTATVFYVGGFRKIKNFLHYNSRQEFDDKKSYIGLLDAFTLFLNVFWSVLFWYVSKKIIQGEFEDLVIDIVGFISNIISQLTL